MSMLNKKVVLIGIFVGMFCFGLFLRHHYVSAAQADSPTEVSVSTATTQPVIATVESAIELPSTVSIQPVDSIGYVLIRVEEEVAMAILTESRAGRSIAGDGNVLDNPKLFPAKLGVVGFGRHSAEGGRELGYLVWNSKSGEYVYEPDFRPTGSFYLVLWPKERDQN
ncbi:MAG: hypothetical protein HQ402_03390 [Parcubacteria group bacterium]|nr:hypothetical protein [Parcubacteria group bacterium]